jgi:uncharacterized membrane protein/osmotically-inducible protein OsmY
MMNRGLTLIGGIGLGAALMYVLDPDRGRRRRARMRDKAAHAINKTGDATGKTLRDTRNRARGLAAEVKSLLKTDRASDEVLIERIRSKMGRVVSHPHSIEVTADKGRVTLRGPVLESEADALLECVSSVPGVTGVENNLEVHKRADNVPGLQGGVARPGNRFELMQTNWSPTARLLVAAAGCALTSLGARRRDALGAAASTAGIGLLTRALTNIETKRLVGVGGGRRAVDFQKTINIAAPVELVFELWTDYGNFPRFMSNVREVRDVGNGRSHWIVAGPADVPVEWDAVVTKLVPNEVLAWKSVPGSTIENAGIIRFEPNDDGSTRVQIKLSYNPPAGAVGHAVATLFGSNPKKQMDEDLMRMKTLIERGVTPRDAAEKGLAAREASARSL